MTYLDPDQTRQTAGWVQWMLRILAMIAVAAIAWVAFTFGGNEGSIRPEIAQEPNRTGPAVAP